MSKQIQTQADKVWQTITDPSTAASYQQTFSLTWTILKETAYLVWLVICLVLVFGDWIWKTGYRAGWATREWVNNLESPSANDLFTVTGKSLLEAGKTGAVKAISTAKEQLGIEDTAEPLAITPAAAAEPKKIAAPEPKPATPPAAPTPPAASTPPAPTPAPATPPASSTALTQPEE